MSSKEQMRLADKISRARLRLQDAKVPHQGWCVVEADQESIAPCNCGASKMNAGIDKAIRELEH